MLQAPGHAYSFLNTLLVPLVSLHANLDHSKGYWQKAHGLGHQVPPVQGENADRFQFQEYNGNSGQAFM